MHHRRPPPVECLLKHISLFGCACISLHYSWIYQTVKKSRLKWQDLLNFDVDLFWAVISVSFIIFLVNYGMSGLSVDSDGMRIRMLVFFGIVFMFNALPEVVYLKGTQSVYAFSEALRFTKENWIEWYLPFMIMLSPWIILAPHPMLILLKFALVSTLLPTAILIDGLTYMLPSWEYMGPILGLVLANWFMIFRGKLFEELDSGSRRRRIYLAKQR